MFIPEITCSLTVSMRLGRISFIACFEKNPRDWLELSSYVYLFAHWHRFMYFLTRLPILKIYLLNALSFNLLYVLPNDI